MNLDSKATKNFLYGMSRNAPFDFNKLLEYFHTEVKNTNELTGLTPFDEEGDASETNEDIKETYVKLRVEEGKEIFEALEDKDRVEFLDGIVDFLVIVGYEYYVHTGELIPYDPSGSSVLDDLRYLKETFKTPYEDIDDNRLYHMLQAAHHIFVDLNIDHFEALTTVIESNLSKFPEVSEVCSAHYEDDVQKSIRAEIESIEDGGRYGSVEGLLVTDAEDKERVVFWANTEYGEPKRKYVKPFSFKEPDFHSCWRCDEVVFDTDEENENE